MFSLPSRADTISAFGDGPGQHAKSSQMQSTTETRLNGLLGHLDSSDKILIYAFGAFDRYYICWQDKRGAYQQGRQGLPPVLDQWLFPPDGSKRDLATLQVSLGHNDEFFAFDQYERISHINTELRDSSNSLNQKMRSKELARLSEELVIRRKSHTISFADDAGDDEQRRSSIAPGGLKRKVRPMSIAISGVSFLASSHEKKKSQSNQASRVLPVVLDEEQRHSSAQQRPIYSDAGVQTDVTDHDDQDTSSIALSGFPVGQRTSQVSSNFSWSSLLPENSQRVADGAMPLADTSPSPAYLRNPVCMGGMNRYFRERQYRLGDSLIRRPSFGIGAH